LEFEHILKLSIFFASTLVDKTLEL